MRRVPCLLMILDGAADRPHRELEEKTPLELAHTPNLNWLASQGASSLIEVLPNGVAPQSHTGILSLLGYDVTGQSVPRGPIEALGHFGRLPQGVLCARCNFASSIDGKILNRRVYRSLQQSDAEALARYVEQSVHLSTGESFWLRSISTYRLSWVLHPNNDELCADISGTDPIYVGNSEVLNSAKNSAFRIPESVPLIQTEAAEYTAAVVNEFTRLSHSALISHPLNSARIQRGEPTANYILCREFGRHPLRFQTFSERYGLSAACICGLPIEIGVCMLLGIHVISEPMNAAGAIDYSLLGNWIFRALKNYDLVLVHLKGPDEPGHDGDWQAKVKTIEQIDSELFSVLRQGIDLSKCIITVTSDHATPWSLGIHSSDRVPILIAGGKIVPDDTAAFCESACRNGRLPIKHASELLPFLRGVNENVWPNDK